jgi:sarcosine oxidase subunit delta
MLFIHCPHCGPRPEDEFGYGGQAHVAYPHDPYALSDREWAEYLFYRDNPKGTYRERWVHAAGCRKWFNAVRDTRTYEISETYLGSAPESQQTPVNQGASS